MSWPDEVRGSMNANLVMVKTRTCRRPMGTHRAMSKPAGARRVASRGMTTGMNMYAGMVCKMLVVTGKIPISRAGMPIRH
jgi:hypothetical protein